MFVILPSLDKEIISVNGSSQLHILTELSLEHEANLPKLNKMTFAT
jgi:hypothetical protein